MDKYMKEMSQLHEAAEKDLDKANDLLIDIWKETKDQKIESYFREVCHGIIIDGVFMFAPFKGK